MSELTSEEFPFAFPNVSGDCFTIDSDSPMFQKGIESSRLSPRKRIILPIHRTQADRVQRMLNFFQPGTYVQPHCHPLDFASETIYLIQGRLGFIEYTNSGTVKTTHLLKPGSLIDIVPCLYHSMIALESDTVVLEIKRGPYTKEDKIFADWSPSEGSVAAKKLLTEHEKLFL